MISKRILILGGVGFIGVSLTKYFMSQGHQVTVFDLKLPHESINGVEYITGDFFNDEDLSSAIKDHDIIIHAVSTINPGNSNIRFLSGYEKDLVQSVKLFSMLVGTQTKLVFLSSGGTVYGEQQLMPINENSLTRPINHYGSIKLCIENSLRTFNSQFGTNLIIARISNPYGPGQNHLTGVGFIDAALKNAIYGDTIEIWGNGENIRDYIYITDACKMIYSLCFYGGPEDTFNISSGCGVSQNDIIKIIRDLGIKPNVSYRPARTVDVKTIVLDNSRIRTIYKDPITDIFTGIKLYRDYLLSKKIADIS